MKTAARELYTVHMRVTGIVRRDVIAYSEEEAIDLAHKFFDAGMCEVDSSELEIDTDATYAHKSNMPCPEFAADLRIRR